MRKMLTILATLLLTVAAMAQTDRYCLRLMGVPLEGPVDSLHNSLAAAGWTGWGHADDGEDYYYRGMFYGIRAKLMVSIQPSTRLVTSAYVTIGPYSTQKMLERNMQYFLRKMHEEHGEFTARGDSWVYMDDYGSIKLSLAQNDTGSQDIRLLYYVDGAYYKDALSMGLRGPVQEVVTENAVAEDQFLHFDKDGRIENPDLQERQYDRYGYLRSARMTEQEGYSLVSYVYDSRYRLLSRTLTNPVAHITYVNEFIYNDDDELLSESQKVLEQNGECVLTIQMHHNYLTRDDQGNWTTNQLSLTYWEKGSQSQQTTVMQKRTIAYYESD